MTFPNFAAKHTDVSTPLVTPERFVRHLQERGLVEGFVPPQGIILLYQAGYARKFLEREPHRPMLPYPEWLHLLDRSGGKVGVLAFFGIGAPAMAAAVETLAALGVRRFINLGSAGGLQTGDQVGQLVVCEGAVRDEGVSHHYLPPARLARPARQLTQAIATQLAETGHAYTRGLTWTIDAPYRETAEELRHYRDDGVRTVEMEAAALFAVAEHRGFEAAAAFVLSDVLTDAEWLPDFGSPTILHGLDVLVEAAVEVLMRSPDADSQASARVTYR